MASDLNVVALVGRLTKDCTIRSTNSGSTVCSFSIAVNRNRKDASGNWSDEVNYFNCVYFLRSNSGLTQYLVKGQQVSVNGELHQNVWEQNGQKRYSVEVYVNSLSLLSRPKNGGGNFQSQGRNDQFRSNGYPNQNQNQGNFQNTNSANPVAPASTGYNRAAAPAAPPVQQSVPSMGNMDNIGPEGFDDDIPF